MSKSILDPIYGEITIPDYAWAASKAPEVQRLREVRMCNINSLSLTGAGGVHRFEHSIGTTFLAQVNVQAGMSKFAGEESKLLTLAALLHDVGSAGFGHSVEYILHQDGFRHDDLLAFSSEQAASIGYEYKLAGLEPVFFGRPRMLIHELGERDLGRISELVGGNGRLGPLISGSVDLDNIDNVYRLAYHVGTWRGGTAPQELAQGLYVDGDGLCIDKSVVHLLNDWREVRSELYNWLLLDEDEFSAKAMLESALRSAYDDSDRSFRWHDVDYSLMFKLTRATAVAADLAERIMTGDLFGCLGIFETLAGSFATPSWADRDALELALEDALRKTGSRRLARLGISVHFIQDVNKTDREVFARTSDQKQVHFGSSIDRTLIGVFAKNTSLAADSAGLKHLRDIGIEQAVQRELSALLEDSVRAVHRNKALGNDRLDYFA